MNRQSIKDLKSRTGQLMLNQATELKLIESNEEFIYEKIHMKYKIL